MFLIISIFLILPSSVFPLKPNPNFLDICGINNGKRLYVEFGISGTLSARYKKHIPTRENYFENLNRAKKCSVEFVTCPSCIIELKFSYLNISRTCGKTSIYDTCSCDYVLLNEPAFEDRSGEQFCGRFRENNTTHLAYASKTRSIAIEFSFSGDYGHAFSLDFTARRNRIEIDGYPKIGQMNNSTQSINSPFFPHLYPTDLSVEYVIACHSEEFCRISLVFTDFLLAESSIIEFFDWTGSRMYVTSGSVFRPPVIVSSGPGLTIRFYANGASDFGFEATYSYVLGHVEDTLLRPNIDCGGHVTNLGGGITMMNMIMEGNKFFDCVWLIKPPSNYMHKKTHLYVKVVNFSDFGGTTELIIRQGLTSNEPVIETLKYPLVQFNPSREKEHVVPIAEGFYVSLRGFFKAESQMTIVYAAFNYKDCYSGLDFLCHNLRCISMLLNCDGFDHCGDSSDESTECSQDPRDHRRFSKIPNFLFPKNNGYSDLTTATFVFVICTFGLIGIIFAMALLLYKVNIRARHQQRIQDHLETIHAILEDGVGNIEEEIISPDDPPDYEPPPEYADVFKYLRKVTSCGKSTQFKKSSGSSNSLKPSTSTDPTISISNTIDLERPLTVTNSKSCQTTPSRIIPDSPPPDYENISVFLDFKNDLNYDLFNSSNTNILENLSSRRSPDNRNETDEENMARCFSSKILDDLGLSWKRMKIRKNADGSETNSQNTLQLKKRFSSEENLLARYCSDSEMIFGRNLTKNIEKTNLWHKSKKMRKSFSSTDLFFSDIYK